MSGIRKSARYVIAAGLLAGSAAPSAAQYQQPYPPYQQRYPQQYQQPYPAQPPQRGRFAHACFPAEQGGYLRVEWTASGRWAVYNWPPGSNLRIYIGDEPAQWCWSSNFSEMTRRCRPNYATTKPVQPGC
jgi:hypothetical protein